MWKRKLYMEPFVVGEVEGGVDISGLSRRWRTGLEDTTAIQQGSSTAPECLAPHSPSSTYTNIVGVTLLTD